MNSTAVSRGAVPLGPGVEFRVWAPRAKRVDLHLEDRSQNRTLPMQQTGDGIFERTLPDLGVGCDYRFQLDGTERVADPATRHQPDGVHGASRVVDPSLFAWSDASWRGVERPDLVIYELHVGTFSKAGSFEGVIERLPVLRDLGVTAIELMPIAQFSGARNWGYDGVFPYAAQESYGGPDGLARLVDAAHGCHLAVLLDVVYNHLGPEGNVLERFGPYFTDRYRTPWGAAVNFDGPGSDEVRLYFVENALQWIRDFHIDGLRLDAVHAILDTSARPFLTELREAVEALGRRLSREVHLIAESDANDPRLVRPPDKGGTGLDGVWNDDFHHAVHAALTGERAGYYVDYGDVEQVAKAYREHFVYDGIYSRHRGRRHGAPAGDVPADRFVVCVQNHDQIGNRAQGERLSALVEPPALRLATALLLLAPSIPLLFMGEEYGESAPFLYFVSHSDPELVAAVRRGRRAEFASFGEPDEVPDPQAEASFERSRLDPSQSAQPRGAGLLALHRELLRLRRCEPLLRPGAARLELRETGGEGFAACYAAADSDGAATRLFAAFQLGARGGAFEAPPGARWQRLLASEDPLFGGSGAPAPSWLDGGETFLVPGSCALLYAREAT